jgi:hypothetical protein
MFDRGNKSPGCRRLRISAGVKSPNGKHHDTATSPLSHPDARYGPVLSKMRLDRRSRGNLEKP